MKQFFIIANIIIFIYSCHEYLWISKQTRNIQLNVILFVQTSSAHKQTQITQTTKNSEGLLPPPNIYLVTIYQRAKIFKKCCKYSSVRA